MAGLPVNIEDLINGKTVEWERIEFKKGWNPGDVIHTMCAFANDINDWDGGYIIIGIEEKNGTPILPPEGVKQEKLDGLQKEIIKLCHRLQPHYRPIIAPEFFHGKHILILWCPAGDMRPYKAPKSLAKDNNQYLPYIRSGSITKIARGEELRQLEELTARIPFDDRINQQATLDDLSLGLIRDYLKEIGSNLFPESHEMRFEDLCKQMHIVKGPDEGLRPVNVGLMFFNRNPEDFFGYAWIELVVHKDHSGRNFIEKIFKGPLNRQLKDALDYTQSNIIVEEVRKAGHKAEADRFYNYPYEAIEEVLANAVYHKGYDLSNPIEVQVFPNESIEVLSYPGPVPPIDNKMLKRRRVTARRYRNRRIGEFLKELELTEGKATGIPLIRDAMANNGSPAPEFYTDDERTIFQATLKIHPWFKKAKTKPKESVKIHVSSQDWNIQSLEDVDRLLEFLQNVISEQVSKLLDDIDSIKGNQVSNQVKDADLENNKGVSDQVGDQVGDQVSDVVGDIVGKMLGFDVTSDPGADFSNQVGNQVKGIDIEADKLVSNQVSNQVSNHAGNILKYCLSPKKSKSILTEELNISNQTKNFNTYVKPLLDKEWLARMGKPKSSKQTYQTTTKGKLLLLILRKND